MQHPAIATQIWDKKYRLGDEHGQPVDLTVEDSWRRVAKGLSEFEGPEHIGTFEMALWDYKFLPAGRILSGTGTGREVTLFNCYVMGTIPDSIDGIFSMLREAALTMQRGGGIGYDFSTIRPKGAIVKGVGSEASGPLSFMDVWDSMCRTIMSAGERRGAMMATMRCDHPDILDFVTAKKSPGRLSMFNLSVLVTDSFMEAVESDGSWALIHEAEPLTGSPKAVTEGYVYEVIKARGLWNAIMEATYNQAEPGVLFIDRINQLNNLAYCETISASNPCGEQPLPPYGACLLGSMNLTKFVRDPFSAGAYMDLEALAKDVKVAVRMLDNVIDVSKFPLEAQKEEAMAKRRIGLGLTGLADALAMCRVRYGTERAAATAKKWMYEITYSAYSASIDLAKEKGAFPKFDVDGYLREGSFVSTRMPLDIKAGIRAHGIRNALLTSIAPTGTISLYAGNVSSGLEPIFAYEYTRKVLQGDGSHTEETVVDYAVALYNDMFPGEELPSYFVSAQELTPSEHLLMQSALQEYVDSAISKTINCPQDISLDEFSGVYDEAYKLGCKGCATYRPNDITGSVLEVSPEPEGPDLVPMGQPADRPRRLAGATYKLKWPNEPHALYVSFTDQVTDEGPRPFEMFINSKNVGHFQWTVALTRMISAVFRRGGNVSFVANELREVFDPKGGAWMNGTYVPSLLAALGDIVAEHMVEIGYGDFRSMTALNAEASASEPGNDRVAPTDSCKECGSYNLSTEGGCVVCKDCGSSKCG